MTNNPDEEIELSDYFLMLRKNWVLAIIIFLIVMGAAIAYTTLTPKIYQGRSLVMVTTQDQTSFLLGSGSSIPRIDMETQREIILSGSVLNSVYLVPEVAEFIISVDTIKNSNIIDIRVESENPLTAMRVANRISESYVNYTRDTKKQEALEVNNFIAEQLAIYKTELDQLNMQIIVYKNKDNLTTEEEFTYQSLQQSIDAKEKLYTYLLSRAEEISIIAKEKGGNVRIIQYAGPQSIPVKPNVILYLALGFILAVIMSVGVVLLKDSTRTNFKSIKEIETALDTMIMGVIPFIKKKEYVSSGSFVGGVGRFFTSPGSFFRKHFRGKRKKSSRFVLMEYNSGGSFVESIRMLKTNLLLRLKDKGTKFISVTSAQSGDGKTTIASNLAIDFAGSGKKVLLVDANLRKPVLNKIFNVKHKEEGLGNVLLGDAKLDKVIQKTTYKNLYLLTAGKIGNFTSEFLSSDKIKEVFTRLKTSRLDIVIFDNASLEYSESVMVSANSQGVVFVTAFDKTNKELAIKAKASLSKVKANILGVVVNFFK